MTLVSDKVKVIAPMLNQLIDDFENGVGAIRGVETFQEEVIKMLVEADVLEKNVWYQVDNVACHPDNREKNMLLPIDVQELLCVFIDNGFVNRQWDAMASEVPPSSIGESWLNANKELSESADGMLAPCDINKIQIVTGRGSHGTAALRALKLGAKGTKPEHCDADGILSTAKVLEIQPSLAEPLNKGCPYDVVKWEVVVAVPRLMEVLSRVGNATHTVYRQATTLQHCSRIHALAMQAQKSGDKPHWETIARQSCIGLGPEFMSKAVDLCAFVREWSGGEDGAILKNMEAYERTLTVKRKLYSNDFKLMSQVDPHGLSRYIPAMVKCMLNSPTADPSGYANIFTSNDYLSLSSQGRNRPFGLEANKLMDAAHDFVAAYARDCTWSPTLQSKLLGDLEGRLVMHVHQKKYATRASFDSLMAVCRRFYDDAKHIQKTLPVWKVCKELESPTNAERTELAPPIGAPADMRSIREVRDDGKVSDECLSERGFKIGVMIKRQGTDDSTCVKIAKIIDPEFNNIEVVDGKDRTLDPLKRVDVIRTYRVVVIKESKRWLPADRSPSLNLALQETIIIGCIKNSLLQHFNGTGESFVSIQEKPTTGTFAIKHVKPGQLKLTCLTNNVSLLKLGKQTPSNSGFILGDMVAGNGVTIVAVARSQLTFPQQAKGTGFATVPRESFMPAFWAVQESKERDQVNCERGFEMVNVKCAVVAFSIKIPFITNTVAIDKNVELRLPKATDSDNSEDDDKPPAKKARPSGAQRRKGTRTMARASAKQG